MLEIPRFDHFTYTHIRTYTHSIILCVCFWLVWFDFDVRCCFDWLLSNSFLEFTVICIFSFNLFFHSEIAVFFSYTCYFYVHVMEFLIFFFRLLNFSSFVKCRHTIFFFYFYLHFVDAEFFFGIYDDSFFSFTLFVFPSEMAAYLLLFFFVFYFYLHVICPC